MNNKGKGEPHSLETRGDGDTQRCLELENAP